MGIPGRTLGAPSLLLIRPQRVESSAFAESAAPTAGLATPATCTCHPRSSPKPLPRHLCNSTSGESVGNANVHLGMMPWILGGGCVNGLGGSEEAGKGRQRLRAVPQDERWAVIKDLYLPGNNSCPSPAFQGATPG